MRHVIRTAPLAALAALCCLAGPASAQAPAAKAPAVQTTGAAAAADPVVARVNGIEIRLSDVKDAAQSLPAQYRGMPPQTLYPALVNQLVDLQAVVALARKQGLDKDPEVQRQMARAGDEALQSALFHRDDRPAGDR